MKAHATLKNMDSESCKPIIARNLKRILDIRIIEIDIENSILHFLYSGQKAYEKVKKELDRIGFPIQQCNYEPVQNSASIADNINRRSITIGRARKSYFFTGQ